jgi:deoxyribose-phosphate aldolase
MTILAQSLVVDATDPYLTEVDLRHLVIAAKDAGLHGLCVLPGWVAKAAIMVARSGVRVRTLIGYPGGVHVASVKGLETRLALQEGAYEVAVAPNMGYFLGGDELSLKNEIAYVAKALREVAPTRARTLGVIFDMARLQPDQIDRFGALVLTSGGHGVHLLLHRLVEPDTIRSLLRSLTTRSTTMPITIQMPVHDVMTAQALLNAGVHYIVTPNAAALARG